MSIALCNAVPAGAIDVLYYNTSRSYFKRADFGRYFSIADIIRNFMNSSESSTTPPC